MELELLFIGQCVCLPGKDRVPVLRDYHHELLLFVGSFIWNIVCSRGRYIRYGLQNQNVEGNCNGKQ